jgi:glycosyltransferase involved in cell wall biosynthesis
MKLALIGPGILNIPPRTWGAVEIIIWNHKVYLEQLGHEVDIYNSTDLASVAREINDKEYDFIHLQYDAYTGFFNAHLTKPFCVTSHYGNLPNPNLWENPYPVFFMHAFATPGIICLSDRIRDVYYQCGYTKYLAVLRNGVEFDKFAFDPVGNGKAVCIGNIQPRKRQAMLANFAKDKVQIDFVGPNPAVTVSDIDSIGGTIDIFSGFKEKGFAENSTCRYLGSWSKQEIYTRLTEYSCLVLLSVSEADPLVVKEALAAGLSIIVSEHASANLDEREFITVIPEKDMDADTVVAAIEAATSRNGQFRTEIREYARTKFDYKVVVHDYIKIMEHFTSHMASLPKT